MQCGGMIMKRVCAEIRSPPTRWLTLSKAALCLCVCVCSVYCPRARISLNVECAHRGRDLCRPQESIMPQTKTEDKTEANASLVCTRGAETQSLMPNPTMRQTIMPKRKEKQHCTITSLTAQRRDNRAPLREGARARWRSILVLRLLSGDEYTYINGINMQESEAGRK